MPNENDASNQDFTLPGSNIKKSLAILPCFRKLRRQRLITRIPSPETGLPCLAHLQCNNPVRAIHKYRSMTQLKRLILGAITLVVLLLLGSSLFSSLNEPQITDRLQLYQTDLLLQTSELQAIPGSTDRLPTKEFLLGKDPIGTALEQYQTVRKSAEANLNQLQERLAQATHKLPNPDKGIAAAPTEPATPAEQTKQLQVTLQQQQALINQLDLRIGLLQAAQNKPSDALKTWTGLVDRLPDTADLTATAKTLIGLWSEPPRILPDVEQQVQKSLEGWFRDRSLSRLYGLQQRQDALTRLEALQQETAQKTLVRLALVSVAPVIGGLIGVVMLIAVVGQWLIRSKQPQTEKENYAWDVPWTGETIWLVLIVGFFFCGQIVIPLVLGSIGIDFSGFGTRAKAFYTLTYYLLMAGSGLLVLYLAIRSHLPLPEGWFRLTGKRNWFFWGISGYFVALPLMLAVSLINQQIWQGQGGSNPLLQIVLEEGDPVALGIFLFTAAVAAPVFEELLFRGFLLPSLTRYVPVSGAIALSSLVFAIAHLSLSEVLPLAVLGSVLGFVYTRSRGLLAPMLLHSLWNSITMIGLFTLGSGVN